MTRYIAQRLLAGLLTAFIVSLLIFALLRIAIDQEDFAAIEPLGGVSLRPTEEQRWTIRERLGLNAPLHIQYFRWMGGWITGEWAESSFSGEEIWESFIPRLPTTLQLVATAQAIVVLAGIPAGYHNGPEEELMDRHSRTRHLQDVARVTYLLDIHPAPRGGSLLLGVETQHRVYSTIG